MNQICSYILYLFQSCGMSTEFTMGSGSINGDSSLNFWICKRERWSAAVFFIPGIWTALNKILNCNVRTTNFLTNFIIVGSLEDCLLMIWTTPELSVKNVTHLLLKALPHNCIATTIGKNFRIVIWYFNQSVGHLIANQCFRNRPPNPILLASVYKFNCSDVSHLSDKKRHFPLKLSTKISQACISDLPSLLRRG